MTEVTKSNLDDLRREVGRIAEGHGSFQDITQSPDFRVCEPVPADARLRPEGRASDGEPFGRWLLSQKDRGDWIDEIASAARKDPLFPKNGTPDEVRKHMATRGADSDVFEALDDAELDWSSL